jgi:hypothetical protein
VRTAGPRLRAIRYAQWQISRSFLHLRSWGKALLSDWHGRGRAGDELPDPAR